MTQEGSLYKILERSSFVKIRYRVRIPDGLVLKGAQEPELMDFVTGYAQVVPGLERRLLGRSVGEKMAFTVPPEEAFGPRYPELVIEKNKADFHFPPGMTPYVGMELPIIFSGSDGPDTVMIKEIRGDIIVVDGNHALAGASLQYDLEIVETRPATPDDICSEWEERCGEETCGEGESCSSGLCQMVLGKSDAADQ
jgi:FKBP-type peptidyl-prolyl cis-trans isomerase SlyD